MPMPFAPDAFFEVFAKYNLALWPAVLALWLAAAVVLAALVVRSTRVRTDRSAALLLVVLWLWGGAVYHAVFFTAINPVAWAFAAFFVVEAGLLAWFALVRKQLTFGSASPRVRGPTTLFTVGLLLTCERPPVAVTLVPVFWSLVAGSAALSLGVPADLMLLASASLLVAHVAIGVRVPIQVPQTDDDPHPELQRRMP